MNERLGNTTSLYEEATITTSTIMSDGYGEWRLSPSIRVPGRLTISFIIAFCECD